MRYKYLSTNLVTQIKNQKGASLIELLIAMAIFAILVPAVSQLAVGTYSSNRASYENDEAVFLNQQAIEAARSIKKQGWDNPFLATNCSSGCGIDNGGGNWVWNGSNTTSGKFTTTILVEDVERNGSDEIVESGGTDDEDTKKITATTTWDFLTGQNRSISYITYVTNFVKSIGTDWSNASEETSENLSGGNNGIRVATNGNYAYLIRSGGSPDFYVFDISNTSNPSVEDTLSLDGTLRDIAYYEDHVYIVGTDNSDEVIVVDVSDPDNVSVDSTENLSGGTNARSVYATENYVYVARDNGSANEFYIFDRSNASNLSLINDINLGVTVYAIYVDPDEEYAYIATSGNSAEVAVLDVDNPNSISVADTLNISGNNDMNAVDGFTDTNLLAVGRDSNGDFYTIDMSDPTDLDILGFYDAGDDINDLIFDDSGAYVFLGTDDNSEEFQVIDVSDPDDPTNVRSVNLNGDVNGVAYSASLTRVLLATDGDEFVIIEP